MAIQKKNAKARLDKYYYLAKEKGYRARAAFKLIQLNKKFAFLQNTKCLIDLCAAPGSWLQVAAETMPVKSLIVGVDLSPIKPIPKTITFQGDITTDKTRAIIRGHLKTWKADTVIHDGAPNVGTAWVQDAFSQNELVLCSLKLASEFLAQGGTFVTKVFRSKDSAKLEWIFKQLFDKVDQTKPPSSRNVSAETFYVCRGFKAPKQLDPRFLDSRYAFAEVEAAAVNMEARVFKPEMKKRKRDGYDEGDYTQFHEVSASEFVQTADPIKMLGSLNRLHFRQEGDGDIALAALDQIPETTEEIRLCCADLKVLGRKEFKLLLRWRLKARTRFGFRPTKVVNPNAAASASSNPTTVKGATDDTTTEGVVGEEVATLEPLDAEMKLQAEIQDLKDQETKMKRKDRRKQNELKQKEIVRMQMHMTTPTEIGIEAGGPAGEDGTFRLRDVNKAGIGREITRGKMHTAFEPVVDTGIESDQEFEEDEELDALEAQLDSMYEQYQEKKEDRDAKARAKRVRKETRGEDDDDEFDGFGEDKDSEAGAETDGSSDDDLIEDDDSADEGSVGEPRLMAGLKGREDTKSGLSGRAANFFQQDIFKNLDGMDEEPDSDMGKDSGIDVNSGSSLDEKDADVEAEVRSDKSDDEAVFETELSDVESETSNPEPNVDRIESLPAVADDEDWSEGKERLHTTTEGRPNIDIITAEAMTLAHALATGKTTRANLEDDNFSKLSHRDVDGLPEWFLDDENKHSRRNRPITAEAAAAIKEKTRALNARPIKKVREAKQRKTFRTARRLEKLKKKSEGLAESGEGSEKDRARDIAKLMAKAKKGGGRAKKPPVKVVKAGGANKGAGRPRGVKGKYKMVDGRMKKDVRGEKRLAKKIKGKK